MKKILIIALVLCHALSAICRQKSKTLPKTNRIQIKVIYSDNMPEDSLFLHYKDHYWGNTPGISQNWAESNGQKNSFCFTIENNDKAAYFSIGKWNKRGAGINLITYFLAEPGDNIKIYITKDTLSFTGNRLTFAGKGAAKYQCQYEIEQLKYKKELSIEPYNYTLKDGEIVLDSLYYSYLPKWLKNWTSRNQKSSQFALKILESFQGRLSSFTYNLLKADIISREEVVHYNRFNSSMQIISQCSSSNLKIDIEQKLQKIYAERHIPELFKIPLQYRTLSNEYLLFMVSITGDTSLTKESKYSVLKNNHAGLIWDRIVTAYLLRYSTVSKEIEKEIADALLSVKTEYCRKLISPLSTLTPGTLAFNFELPDSANVMSKLSDFKGKVIVMDFWFTGCGGCAALAKKMKPIQKYFEGNDKVIFVTISVDRDREKWITSLKNEEYTHKGSIDLYTNGTKNPIIKHYNIVAYPTIILIDPNGKLISASPPKPPKDKEFIALIEKHLPNQSL